MQGKERSRAWGQLGVRAFAGAMLALAMVGCTTTQHGATVTNQTTVAADQGVVLLSVTSNSPRTGQFDNIVLEAELAEQGVKHSYRMAQVARGISRDTALFVGVLPDGRYRVTRFEVGTLFIDINEASRERIGTVVVSAGKTRDLGRLIVTNLNDRVLIGRSGQVKSNVELIRRYAPDAARFASNVEGTGWAAERSSKDLVEEFALSTPAGAESMTELPGGEVVAVSRLGSILVRPTDGKWRRVGIGGLESLLALAAVDEPDTRLVAVGEFGTIVRMGSNWKVQRVSPGNLPSGNLIRIAGNSRVGWHVAQSEGSRVVIYRSDRLEGGDWRAIRTVELGSSIWLGQARFWSWVTAEGLGYALSSGEIHHLNFATQAWTQTAAPEGRGIMGIHMDPGGVLSMLSSPSGIWGHLYVSQNQGALWTELKSPLKVNGNEAIQLASGATLLQGSVFSGDELYLLKPGATDWTKYEKGLTLGTRLTALPNKGIFAVDDGANLAGFAAIRRSSDEGRTWTLEYSNYVDTKK